MNLDSRGGCLSIEALSAKVGHAIHCLAGDTLKIFDGTKQHKISIIRVEDDMVFHDEIITTSIHPLVNAVNKAVDENATS